MTALVRRRGRDQASGRRRGVVSPQRTDGSRGPDEGWYSRRYAPLLPGGRLTQPHRGRRGSTPVRRGEGCHGVQGGPFLGVLAPQPLQRRGRRPSRRAQPKPRGGLARRWRRRPRVWRAQGGKEGMGRSAVGDAHHSQRRGVSGIENSQRFVQEPGVRCAS